MHDAVFAFGCLVPTKAEAAIKISKKTAALTVGKTLQLKVSGTKLKVTWSSSNKSVASVTLKGKVTAKKKGTATIMVAKGKDSCYALEPGRECALRAWEADDTWNSYNITLGVEKATNIIGNASKYTVHF